MDWQAQQVLKLLSIKDNSILCILIIQEIPGRFYCVQRDTYNDNIKGLMWNRVFYTAKYIKWDAKKFSFCQVCLVSK